MKNNYSFHGQRSDENVIAVWQRHPWSYLKAAITLLLFSLIPWLIYLLFSFTKVFTFATFIILMIAFLWLLLIWFLWRNNLVILTNQRIMHIEMANPIAKKVTEVPLKNIQHISFENRGLISTIFGFGNILLQTAGSSAQDIILKNLADPYDIQQLISKTANL